MSQLSARIGVPDPGHHILLTSDPIRVRKGPREFIRARRMSVQYWLSGALRPHSNWSSDILIIGLENTSLHFRSFKDRFSCNISGHTRHRGLIRGVQYISIFPFTVGINVVILAVSSVGPVGGTVFRGTRLPSLTLFTQWLSVHSDHCNSTVRGLTVSDTQAG